MEVCPADVIAQFGRRLKRLPSTIVDERIWTDINHDSIP